MKPQKELKSIRKSQTNLAGIIAALTILETTGLMRFKQKRGYLQRKWLKHTKGKGNYCSACIGAFLAWFFQIKMAADGYWYADGNTALAEYLGVSGDKLDKILQKIMRVDYYPFGLTDWEMKPSAVFAELQQKFPEK